MLLHKYHNNRANNLIYLKYYIQLFCFDNFFACKYSTPEGYLCGHMQKWVGLVGAELRAAKVMAGTHFSTKLCNVSD